MTLLKPSRYFALAGFLPAGVVFLMVSFEYTGYSAFAVAASVLAVIAVAIFSFGVRASRVVFVLIAIALVLWAALTNTGWMAATALAAQRGAMVMALFTALTAIRNAAISAPAIVECGRFLARQRSGLRYTALTIGGHLFALVLLYGSISLLGTLATESAAREPDPEIRRQRTRRMMIAIQRGFASTLCWSPLGFSMIISVSVVPGASWSAAALPGLVSALMMLVIGWGLDALYKPQVKSNTRPLETERWVTQLSPLLVLLGLVLVGVALLHTVTGVEVIGAVMSLIPVIAILWIAMQQPPVGLTRSVNVWQRARLFVTRELPSYRGEIVLLFMAGFIGSLGAFLLVPLVQAQGLDLTTIPPWIIVAAMVWIIPVTGQLGMNPILAVSLLVPILPSPEIMGIPPTAMVVAITAGWALSGATSPFTASVMLAASLGGVSPLRAGLGWNGVYVLAAGAALTLWALLLFYIL
ncbi:MULTISPECIES: hypothetical protein [unclassified Marinobacter]|uniref:hypothetical protein n=1 Tax=unclassified Marinobacter TaxID=83889 RepID=UPI00200E13D6|nr:MULTISPECIES: hypothetical protein [unclassified Marinobacter]UQG56530.1 hypothetical protein MIH16_02290 [Marinobacter sp. M4C]UQG65334.1 hypothetical protein MIH17_02290 [Marinobacter sp. M2C]UQG69613.1 hypothetical protein MIH19_02285 [Marinobacter sp. M1C]